MKRNYQTACGVCGQRHVRQQYSNLRLTKCELDRLRARAKALNVSVCRLIGDVLNAYFRFHDPVPVTPGP